MANNIFQDPETLTTTVIIFLIDRYTAEVLTWDLETISLEVKDDFKTDINPAVLDKIAVGQLLLTTNMFHTSLPDFINFCNVMNNETGLKYTWSPADSYEMTWAVAEEKLLVNEDDNFTADIQAYITTVLRDDGIVSPPDSLAFISTNNLAGPQISKIAEDPVLYQASYEEAIINSDSLQQYLDIQFDKLKDQLSRLTLKNGDLSKIL